MADVKPGTGESLIAFAHRCSVDAAFRWNDFQRLALGGAHPSLSRS
jgi:hypothetical protein